MQADVSFRPATGTDLLDSEKTVMTFRMSPKRREMYCGHARLCVCVSVCCPRSHATLLHEPGCNLGEW